jgi:hypothetical protein
MTNDVGVAGVVSIFFMCPLLGTPKGAISGLNNQLLENGLLLLDSYFLKLVVIETGPVGAWR